MSSGLSEYMQQLRLRAGQLEYAAVLDDICMVSERPPKRNGETWQRHWTRQDRNRLDYECALEEAGVLQLPSPLGRTSTRVERLVRRFRLPGRAIKTLHARALQHAHSLGIYGTIAALLAECTQAHEALLAFYAREDEHLSDGSPSDDWGERVLGRHFEALTGLELYIPVEANTDSNGKKKPTPATLEAIRMIQAGKSNDEINGATGKSVGNIDTIRTRLKNEEYAI